MQARPAASHSPPEGRLDLKGSLAGQAKLAGLPGGTLSITDTNPTGTLSLSISELAGFRERRGFDALTLASADQLSLTGSGQVAFGGSQPLTRS